MLLINCIGLLYYLIGFSVPINYKLAILRSEFHWLNRIAYY